MNGKLENFTKNTDFVNTIFIFFQYILRKCYNYDAFRLRYFNFSKFSPLTKENFFSLIKLIADHFSFGTLFPALIDLYIKVEKMSFELNRT